MSDVGQHSGLLKRTSQTRHESGVGASRLDVAPRAAGPDLADFDKVVPVAGLVRGTVQFRLVVGAANDPLEREADEAAARVLAALRQQPAAPGAEAEPAAAGGSASAAAGPASAATAPAPVAARAVVRALFRAPDAAADTATGTGTGGGVAPVVGEAGGEASPDIEQAIEAGRGQGAALPAAVRRGFEGAFGADFGAIRLHTGPVARDLTQRLGALAFTVGPDIYFRDGVPNVQNANEQFLLAHELAHTVQQGAAARTPVSVQRLPKDADYKELTGGDKNRNRVLTLDALVAGYNTAAGMDAKRDELDKILVECDNYLALSGHSSRKAGVRSIKKAAQAERAAIKAYEDASAANGKAAMKLLLDALDGYNQADAETGGADYLFTPIDKAISDLKNEMRKTPRGQGELTELIEEDVARLRAMSTDPHTPKVLKKVLVEILGNEGIITFGEGGAGAKQTPTGPTDYAVTSPVGLSGGSSERLSSLTHEMTHVSIGETFDNTAILLAYSQNYTDVQVQRLAAKRLEVVKSLEALLADDKTLSSRQQSLVRIQLGYMKQDKMLTYVTNFEKAGKLPATDAAKLKLLAPTIPSSSLLIEYDTVINQLLLLMHTWEIPRSNALYKKIEKAAADAYEHRQAG